MLKKNDLILLLTDLQEQGIEVELSSQYITDVATSTEIPMEILKFINEQRQLDVASFYNRLRYNYNHKKSDLYKNIVSEIEEPNKVITTLSALALQIQLYTKHVLNEDMFLKHSRIEDIHKVLYNYYKTYDISLPLKLLKLIKSDLLAFEYADGRRDEEGNVIESK